ncbi:MAG: nuclear transport factor 2 family protein [Sphingobium sp.]|nr:nuclear transport factor 2 family protein [Sphingobium sp.]MCP5398152.1 nuclear transport factor 2 family protein [Sphingomonas sp.]
MRELIAELEIHTLAEAFCRNLDRADETALKSLFHQDSFISSGLFTGNGQSFASKICTVMKTVFNQTRHNVTNIRYDIDGDSANGETHMVAVGAITGWDGAPAEILVSGFYVDRLDRRDGTWKFTERRFICENAVQRPLGTVWDVYPFAVPADDAPIPEERITEFWQ